MKTKTKLALGAGAVTAATALAGYYFYVSKSAKKNRRITAKWANDLKKNVVQQVKKIPTPDYNTVLAVIDQAAAGYESIRNIDKGELRKAAGELKKNWHQLLKETGIQKRKAGKASRSPRKSRSR